MVQLLAQIENYQHNLTVQPEKFRSRAESVLGRGWESGFPQNIPASMIQRGIFITFRRENFVATDGTRQRASTADRDHIPPPLFRVYHNDDGYSFSPKSVPSLMQGRKWWREFSNFVHIWVSYLDILARIFFYRPVLNIKQDLLEWI